MSPIFLLTEAPVAAAMAGSVPAPVVAPATAPVPHPLLNDMVKDEDTDGDGISPAKKWGFSEDSKFVGKSFKRNGEKNLQNDLVKNLVMVWSQIWRSAAIACSWYDEKTMCVLAPPQQGGFRFAGEQRAQRSSKTQASLGGVQSEARGARETHQGVGRLFGRCRLIS